MSSQTERQAARDHGRLQQRRSGPMRKAGFLISVLLLAGLGSARGQVVPNPPPDLDPDAHAKADKLYPSAKVCGACHPKQYEEWRVSSHAYADLSPMFNKFEQKINDLAHG